MVLPGVDIVRITRGSIKRLAVEAQFTDKNNYIFKLKISLWIINAYPTNTNFEHKKNTITLKS